MVLVYNDICLITDDNETIVRYGMTAFIRQIGRFVDVTAVAKDLQIEGVFSERERLAIAQESDREEQAVIMVLHMLDETKENLMKFCRCIRTHNPLIADLIEYSNDDGTSVRTFYAHMYKLQCSSG